MKIRAKDKDGNVVVGWYACVQGKHFLVPEQPSDPPLMTVRNFNLHECLEIIPPKEDDTQ